MPCDRTRLLTLETMARGKPIPVLLAWPMPVMLESGKMSMRFVMQVEAAPTAATPIG
jgi:hypothetical protein